MKRTNVPGLAGLICALVPALASAYSSGPLDGFSNNPPIYLNCTFCHATYELNSGDGDLQILGLPSEYVPGQTYPLTVLLEDSGQMRWGFELTVLDDSDDYAQGGDMVVTDPVNTQLSEDSEGTRDYLKQTTEGTHWPSGGPTTWSFDWIAPDLPSVTFYFCGNAANGDETSDGDYIYARSAPVTRREPTPVSESSWGRVKSLYVRGR
ncbi:MAG: choice-of-anchor V domain-containing protein [Candidatus Eisenbacteria bacterium]|uniref:Reelin domain-containing protein n=1 Tax=Eiseniibacteriota bacterium TaxID=2212470 RepID=A0A956LZH5_UNCEI|nr:hypothetical protein [Candidatus Eisenbacteria bacterium]